MVQAVESDVLLVAFGIFLLADGLDRFSLGDALSLYKQRDQVGTKFEAKCIFLENKFTELRGLAP